MMKLNRSIDRGLTVLETVQRCGTCSLAELADRTSLPKASLLRICATLEARRWLARRSSDGRYQVGSAFPQEERAEGYADVMVAVGKEEVLAVSRDTGLAVDLAVAVGGGRIEIVDTSRNFNVHGVHPDTVGYRPSPVLSALGTAYLSALSGGDRVVALRELFGRLPREDAEAFPRLAQILGQIAERGYAVRPSGYWGRAVDYGALPAAIAVPVIAGATAIGAMNLVWNASDYSVEEVADKHLARLKLAAQRIGAAFASAG